MKSVKRKTLAKQLKRFWPFYLMMLPGLVYLFINNYIPMTGLILAFEKYQVADGIYGSPKIGFSNFQFLFQTKDAWIITRNTLLYNLVFIILGNFMAIIVANFLNDVKRNVTKKIYQTIILLPYLVSIVVVAFLANAFLAGDTGFINNHILEPLGFESIQFYRETKYWPFILTFVYLWKTVGYSCIIYLASMSGIDPGLYEAAALDGAGRWQRFVKITIPSLKPTIITLFILAIGKIFYSDFGLFYQIPMQSGSLFPVTQTIDTYVFYGLTQNNNIGMSAAAGFYQSVVGFVLVLLSNIMVKRVSEENAMF
ncbi:sugar ABC transporter permease [Lachnoclostridium sp. An169]|uniref:ABC transporter permease n=1 Tax=Lachnoclostridium sp. An169 TaxID=1965569 RepID=UPI000B3866A7|nr:ABC transporter permease subunit [Lachnoclostridium sp. An169]OUP81615.1 sugar ABC transporter permease [Lachnoclostridium sp. An169]